MYACSRPYRSCLLRSALFSNPQTTQKQYLPTNDATNGDKEREFFATEVTDEQSFRELLRSICETDDDDDDDDDDAAGDESDFEDDDDEGSGRSGQVFQCNRRSSRSYGGTDDGRDGDDPPRKPLAQRKQPLLGRRHREKKRKTPKKVMRSIVGFRAEHAQLNQLKNDLLARRQVAAGAADAATATTAAATGAATAAAKAAPEALQGAEEEAEEETEDNVPPAEKPMAPRNEGNSSSDDGNGGGGHGERSEDFSDQDHVDVGRVEGRVVVAAGENDSGGRAVGFSNIVDVGGPTSSLVSGCNTGSTGGHATFPLIMRILGEESRGEQRVEFPAVFLEQEDRSGSNTRQTPPRRRGDRGNKRAGDGCARRRRIPPSSTPAESLRAFSGRKPSPAKLAGRSAKLAGRSAVVVVGGGGVLRGRAQARGGRVARGGRETGIGEDVVEKQKTYALNDRYLRYKLCCPPFGLSRTTLFLPFVHTYMADYLLEVRRSG